MNYKRLCHNRICRVLICLALICCLIAQMIPARADATAAGLAAPIVQAAGVTVSAPLAITAMAISLGVMAGTNDDFQNLVTTAASSGFEWVKDGTMELLRTVDELGNQMFYVAGEALEGLRSYFFDSGTVSKLGFATSFPFNWGGVSGTLEANFPFFVCQHSCGSYYDASFFSNQEGSVYFYNSAGERKNTFYLKSPSGYPGLYVSGLNMSNGEKDYGVYNLGRHSDVTCNPYNNHYKWLYPQLASLVGSVQSDLDLSLGQIPTVPVDGSSALDWAPEYQAKGLKVIEGGNDPDPDSDPPNDGKWFWPLALTAITAELFAMSQADQWSGVTPPEFSEYSNSADYEIISRPEIDGYQGLEIKPVTNPNPGTGTNPDPDIGGDAGGDTGSDTGNQIDYTSWFRRIVELIEELLERFKTWCTDCKTAIEELPSKFAKWFDNICETLGNIWEWCQNLVSSLMDALQNLLSSLFAPSADFIPNKVSALAAKYPYLETFTGLGTSLKAFFLNLGSKPPIIYIDLGAATGSYFFGGRQAFIDLTWYSDYKPTMDAILGAFIWLWLAWRLFHALPGIINGMSGTVGERVSYSGTQNINLPPLPPQNELPPGHNRRM